MEERPVTETLDLLLASTARVAWDRTCQLEVVGAHRAVLGLVVAAEARF